MSIFAEKRRDVDDGYSDRSQRRKTRLSTCYTQVNVPPSDESLVDKAEAFARRILDRLGSQLESKFEQESNKLLSPRQIGALVKQIEAAIEASLTRGDDSAAIIAPDRFRVRFTYEETSGFTEKYMKAVEDELTSEVQEYITNRRYRTRGPIVVEVSRDLFAKETLVKAEVSQATAADRPAVQRLTGETTKSCTVKLSNVRGQTFSLELLLEAGPLSIGRTVGNAVRIDHPSVSRSHCSMALTSDGRVVASDLGSANGTSVNGRLLSAGEKHPIQAGDKISIGDVELIVESVERT